MGLGLRAATKEILCKTNVGVRISEVTIQRQCLLAVSNALGRAVGEHFDVSEMPVGARVLWGQGQSLDQGLLSRREARGPVIGQKNGTTIDVNICQSD